MEPKDVGFCRLCGKDIGNKEMPKHLKFHGFSSTQYYQKQYPRYDRLTGDIILFKNRETYFTHDFNTKANLKTWLSRQTRETQIDYCKEILLRRKIHKGLSLTPCQTELRTAMLPAVSYLDELFDGRYYEVAAELGFKNRFIKPTGKITGKPLDGCEIIIDTREQLPLSFSCKTKSQKLEFGDYGLSCMGDVNPSNACYIERKGVGDFWGTMSQGYERFQREILRAKNVEAYLVVLVEGSMQDVGEGIGGKYLLKTYSRVNADFLFHRMRCRSQDCDMIQFLFVKNREESTRVIELLLGSEGAPRKYDLQLCYDLKLL